MHPRLLLSNGRLLSTYDLFTLFSIIAAAVFFFTALRREGVKGSQLGWFIFIGIFVQDIGGTILPYLHHLVHGMPIPALPRTPGRWFHSIFLSMALYTWFWIRRFKWPAGRVMDVFFMSAMIMSAVGRIGCFLGGCCGGKICGLPWALHYPGDPEGVLRHPTQLYAVALELLIFAVLRAGDRKRRYAGETFLKGVLLYSVYRFGMGFVRDTPAVAAGLSYAQIFSLVSGAAGLWFFLKKRRGPAA
jgi:phosphatidylglycerol:prolipoprotein diacylglycerol transferase